MFDQEYAVEQYGKAQKEEGRVIEAIDIYRKELKLDDESIITKIMKKFTLSHEEAESYVY